MIAAGALLVVGLALVIVGLVASNLSTLIWVGIAVAIVGGVLLLVQLFTRHRV